MEKIKGFKGFDKDLKCRGFQYEVGKDYEQKGKILCCDHGFHFCEDPFDVLNYYYPNNSRYCEVEGEGEIDRGTKKVAVSHIHIGDELNWNDFINACVRFIFDKVNWNSDHMINNDNYSVAKNKGDSSAVTNNGSCSVAMNTGYHSVAENNGYGSVSMNSDIKSVATNTGERSVAMNDGYKSVATNSGYKSVAINSGVTSAAKNIGKCSVAINVGDNSIATNSGSRSIVSNIGDCSVAMNAGCKSVAINSGYRSVAMNDGNDSVAMNVGDYSNVKVGKKDSVAIVIGKHCKAAGVLGSWLVLTERDCNSEIVGMKAVKVDGTTIKADTWYQLKDGEVIEAED